MIGGQAGRPPSHPLPLGNNHPSNLQSLHNLERKHPVVPTTLPCPPLPQACNCLVLVGLGSGYRLWRTEEEEEEEGAGRGLGGLHGLGGGGCYGRLQALVHHPPTGKSHPDAQLRPTRLCLFLPPASSPTWHEMNLDPFEK